MRSARPLSRAVLFAGLIAVLVAPVSADDRTGNDTLAFGLDLYRQLKSAPENVIFSPYSVSTALAMARVGAKGETARQMDAVLRLPAEDSGATHRTLRSALEPDAVRDGSGRDAKQVPAFTLELANALWVQEGLNLEPSFAGKLEAEFGAPAERIDFRRVEAARARINGWVAKQTRDRIRDIVPEGLPVPSTQLALANAIYFKAAWKQPFKEAATREAPFRTRDGGSTDVPFMHREDTFRYTEDEDAQVVELPYRGNRTSMVIVLPRKPDGLAALEGKLTAARLAAWIGAFKPVAVKLALPRFKFTRAAQLSGHLQALGMKDAFTAGADFSGITRDTPLFIDVVLHKAFIAVDEAGTEAAAATVVMMRKGRVTGGTPFTADHPFLFLIRHVKTGTVLFLGCVEKPGS
jgi:serpin B